MTGDGDTPRSARPAGSSGGDGADLPSLPDRSDDDRDEGWGEVPAADDDERLTRERPPHWSAGD